MTLFVRSSAQVAGCSGCGAQSSRVHARYQRMLADAPSAGRRTRVVVTVRRFKCDNPACALSTFSEQVPHLTTPFARRTPVLTEALVAIALALAGRAGARLATTLGMPCGRDLLIKMIRALPAPEVPAVKVLGVDDFAIRRRHTYNTILIDMATHRPIDVLPDREAATLAAWLVEHPGVEVVCRDRGGAYAEGARTGAPDAIQVADRFHLWQNLCEAVGKTVNSHYHCLRVQAERATPEPEPTPEPVPAAVLAPEPALPPRPERRLAIRTRERFEAVQSRLAAGMSRAAVGRELNLDQQTVRRFADATTLAELLVKCENRVTKLDSYREQVHALWNAGVTDAAVITERIRPLGFTGSVQIVRRYLRAFRIPGTSRSRPDPVRRRAAPSGPMIPKPRKISRWILSHPDHLDHDETLEIKDLLTRCEHLHRLDGHARSFAAIMTGRRGTEITDWIERVEADDLPALHTFATGLRRDLAAVTNGLSLEHNSGAVEGAVTRAKALKRQCYGRANFDLLRLRILLTP
ncbi:ISL3 family transposase [Streptomyces sp. NPDC091217]|uniref:ISL3 family transposase n=1 Tax=Streptomyces sp. NPDC091217 TaxID=3365975 RepID=UPI003808F56A